jgi:MFS family permease
MASSVQTKVPETTSSEPNLRYAYYVLVALMVCYTLSFIDRTILGLLVGPIKRDLAISDTQFGLLNGLAFAIFYTIMGLPLGRVADSQSRTGLITIGVVVWSAMTTVCAGAASFFMLFLARIGVGVGEATLSPGAFSLITDYFPKNRLGRALSIYSMGIFFGAGLALILGGMVVQATLHMPAVAVPLLGTVASWRLTFLIVGLPGVVVALWMWTIREPARKNLLRAQDGSVARLSISEVFKQISMRWESVIGLSVAMIFQSMGTFALLGWGPAYFQRVHHFSPAQTGRALGLVVLTCGCLGMYAGGVMADRWQKAGIRESHLRPGVISGILVMLLIPFAFTLSNPTTTLALLMPGLFCLGLPMGVAYAAMQMILPNQVRGQVSALFLFIFNLGGQTVGNFLPGYLNDNYFHDGLKVGSSIAITIAIAGLLTAVCFFAIYGPYRRHHAAAEQLERA